MDLEKAFNKIDNFCCSNHNTLQGNKVKYLNDREETIDMFQDYKETNDDDFCKDVNEMVEALDTIKDVVDLQKQLECSLDVLVRAIQDGVYYEDVANCMQYLPVDLRFSLDGDFILFCNDDEYLLVKNYKKTWWLKKDKSE